MINIKGFKKLKDKEIRNIMQDISRRVYIDDITEREEFKQVIHKNIYYPYIISSFGRVFSIYYGKTLYDKINLKEMHPTKNKKKGYYGILLFYNKKKVDAKIHILVAEAFILNDNPCINDTVNHLDGIKTNNFKWNLEWCTRSENTLHAYRHGLCKQGKGEDSKKNKYKEKDIIQVCVLLSKNVSIKEISKRTGVSKRNIKHILNNESWTHISSNYDFSSYNFGKPLDYIENVEKVCQLLESNKYTLKEISEITNITYAVVKNILNRDAYTRISDKYKISNFNNYITNKNKKKS